MRKPHFSAPGVRRATIGEVLALRHAVLRPGLPLESARFAGDDDPRTVHVGAFLADAANVGCASFMPSTWEQSPAWQVRGMATRADLRRRGIGAAMLRFAEAELPQGASGEAILWCNARVEAAGFYAGQGWVIVSEEFVIEGVGPHYRMLKRLGG